MAKKIEVECSFPSSGETVEGSYDCDVTILRDGTIVDAEATVVQDHEGGWVAYGPTPEYWFTHAEWFDEEELSIIREAIETYFSGLDFS